MLRTNFGIEMPSKRGKTISSVQSTGPCTLTNLGYLSYGSDSTKVLPDVPETITALNNLGEFPCPRNL